MVELNLWMPREKKLKYENDIVRRYMLVGILISVLLIACGHVWLQTINQGQLQIVNTLRHSLPSENSGVKNNLGDGYFSAESVLQLLQLAANSQTQGLCYSQILRDMTQVNWQGNAWTAAGISGALKQFSLSGLFAEIHLLDIKQQAQQDWLHFTLTAEEA
jgi:hypothetical protein